MTDERFDISRRKALAALGTIGVASAGAGLGTSAYFSDQETFENNSLTAGTLDMGVGYSTHYSDWSDDEGNGVSVRMYDGSAGETGTAADLQSGETGFPTNDAWLIAVDDPDQFLDNTLQNEVTNGGCGDVGANTNADGESAIINIGDVKPGDFGEVTFDLTLCTNPGYVWINNPDGYTASENGTTEPEADDPDEGDGVELLDVVQAAVWLDDGDNYQDGGEKPILSGSLGSVLDALDSGNGVRIDGQEVDATGSKPEDTNFTAYGVNRFNYDGGDYGVDVELDGDPAGSGHVAHITSGGQSSGDYATTAVSVGANYGDISSLTYEHYGGQSLTAANPDEVYLLVRRSDGTREVIWRNDSGVAPGSWMTRDVASQFGTASGWMIITDTGHDSLGESPDSRYSSDAEILAMAAGNGSLSGEVADLYVRNPQVTLGSGEDAETIDLGEFPTACFRGETEFSAAFAWWVPVDHGNEIQSDSVEFDLGFYTEQCRHNDGSGMNNDAVAANQTDDESG